MNTLCPGAHRMEMRRKGPRATARLRTAHAQERLIEKRKLIRAAYDLIRRDPEEKQMLSNFVDALGGRRKITATLLESARQVINERR